MIMKRLVDGGSTGDNPDVKGVQSFIEGLNGVLPWTFDG